MSTGFPGGAVSSSGPRLRIGDAEREHAVGVLGEHYAAGRITHEEFDERSTRAYAAKTNTDLWPLFQDLPALRPVGPAQRSGATRSQVPARQVGAGGRRRGPGAALVLLVLLVLAVFAELPWLVALLIGWFVWGRGFGHCSRAHSSGSRRADRGSWS